MKERKEEKFKKNLLLLIVFALAAGLFLFQPYDKTTNNNTKQSFNKTVNKNNSNQFTTCNNPGTEVSKIIDDQVAMAKDVCLYQQCSGFTY